MVDFVADLSLSIENLRICAPWDGKRSIIKFTKHSFLLNVRKNAKMFWFIW
jgi:phosphotransferase system IIA component